MKIAVLANSAQKEELLLQGIQEGTELLWVNEFTDFISLTNIDACIDLLFDHEEKRIDLLNRSRGTIIVNAVITNQGLPANFIRINGWPTLLKRPIIEAACQAENLRLKVNQIFSCFNKTTEWTSDIPGFASARVIATIINEAYFALDENVSTKNEIDIAMKLGTNYPYGPFEWSEKIGLNNIYGLLIELAKTNSRYKPNDLLKKEALQ